MKGVFMFYLFTYGTLMTNERNNYILEGQKFIKEITLAGVYIMEAPREITGAYPYPVMFFGDEKDFVTGEIYECQDDILEYIDEIESNGFLYNRVCIDLFFNNKKNKVFMYFGNENFWKNINLEKIEDGNWKKVLDK